jgi:hypothetical protein
MTINNKTFKCHRVIAHAFKILDIHSELQIDHRDRDRNNNCIFNLRSATNQQNAFNNNYKGYNFHQQTKKWRARIKIDGNEIHLGLFETEEEAHQKYIEAKKKYHVLNA